MRFAKTRGLGGRLLLALSIGVLTLMPFNGPVKAEEEWLIRTVPMDASAYHGTVSLSEAVQSAEGVNQVIESSDNLLVHMEALRQGYWAMGQNTEEKTKLLTTLKDRYMKDQENPSKFFDYGYAQLMMEGNKNGLFFLRKANDKLTNAATSLAYGLAQIDIDRAMDGASPDNMTQRKIDVMFKLKDAVMYNKEDRLTGLWPSYVNILKGIEGYTAFDSLRMEDVTTIYVPYGNVSMTRNADGGNNFLAMLSRAEDGSSPDLNHSLHQLVPQVVGTCQFKGTLPTNAVKLYSKSIDLDNNGSSESVEFYRTDASQPFTVQVHGAGNQLIGEFSSYKAPYIIEDLDEDGKFELVVRQFEKDPLHPLYVYRWNGSCYGEDKSVTAFFQ